jgi:hypothetical protein
MKMQLEIDTKDRKLGFDLVGTLNSLRPGTKVEIPGSAILTFDGLIGRKAFGFPITLEFIVSFTSAVSAGIVANWLYEKIKGRASTLRIDRTEVQINKGEIERVIIEKIEKSE